MKYLKYLMLAFMLTGCGNQIFTHQLHDIVKQCGGSIDDIHTIWTGSLQSLGRCVDGTEVISSVNASK
jgi:hypothetical protein